MFDPYLWTELLSGRSCPLCDDNRKEENHETLWVGTLGSGRVVLQNDAQFRGYCILVHRRHVTEIFDLTVVERGDLIEDISRIAAAIQAICRPSKLNYAVLGNECPHLHVHVIPRYPDDGWWGKPIWLRPQSERTRLHSQDAESLRQLLNGNLATSSALPG